MPGTCAPGDNACACTKDADCTAGVANTGKCHESNYCIGCGDDNDCDGAFKTIGTRTMASSLGCTIGPPPDRA